MLMTSGESVSENRFYRRDRYVRYGCLLMIAAVGLHVGYAVLMEPAAFAKFPNWNGHWWAVGYLAFVMAYLASFSHREWVKKARWGILVGQAAAALLLVWLVPSFIVTCLLVVVAWQLGWSTPLPLALFAALAQSAVLAAMKCAGETEGLPFVILVIACAFQAFAICAANLAKRESQAHDELERLNAELRATHALMAESVRTGERLRISRDLHDVLGHALVTLTVQLDVAERLISGQATEHVRCAREMAAMLLSEVRAVVNRIRIEPVDLRATLEGMTADTPDLEVHLALPDDMPLLHETSAEAIIRCVQEIITNTLRHADARKLSIELQCARNGSVSIVARDDGRGGPIVEGSGLRGMRERLELLGGTLSVTGMSGHGLKITAALPAGSGLA